MKKDIIEADYSCCWFEFQNPEEVYQKCPYHNQKLIMRSDSKKVFTDRKNNVEPRSYLKKVS